MHINSINLSNFKSNTNFKGYCFEAQDPYAAAFAQMAQAEEDAFDARFKYAEEYDEPTFRNTERQNEYLSRLHDEKIDKKRKADIEEAKIISGKLNKYI